MDLTDLMKNGLYTIAAMLLQTHYNTDSTQFCATLTRFHIL